MTIVPNDLVEKNEGFGLTINRFFDLWIKPYYKEKNKKFDKSKFCSALIEIFPDSREPKIRLNDNVEFKIKFFSKEITQKVLANKYPVRLRDIESINWSDRGLNKNSGKILLVRFNENCWILNFEFLYNKGNAQKILARSEEFLSCVKTILRKKEFCPHTLIYLIWSVAELLLDAKFLLHAERSKQNHEDRWNKLNSPLGQSFFSSDFSSLFLTFSKLKNGARYGSKIYNQLYDIAYYKKQSRILTDELQRIKNNATVT